MRNLILLLLFLFFSFACSSGKNTANLSKNSNNTPIEPVIVTESSNLSSPKTKDGTSASKASLANLEAVISDDAGQISLNNKGQLFYSSFSNGQAKNEKWEIPPEASTKILESLSDLFENAPQNQVKFLDSKPLMDSLAKGFVCLSSTSIHKIIFKNSAEQSYKRAEDLLVSVIPQEYGVGPDFVWLGGKVEYDDLEGGLWKITVTDGTQQFAFVLQDAPGHNSMVSLNSEAVHQITNVRITGKPVAHEDNYSINMAGPSYQVYSMMVK